MVNSISLAREVVHDFPVLYPRRQIKFGIAERHLVVRLHGNGIGAGPVRPAAHDALGIVIGAGISVAVAVYPIDTRGRLLQIIFLSPDFKRQALPYSPASTAKETTVPLYDTVPASESSKILSPFSER